MKSRLPDRLPPDVQSAYDKTASAFREWSRDSIYRPYVVPPATAPNPGFAIFYSPPKMLPELLIVGQNPSNFAGKGAALTAEPNGQMLSGKPPTVHSYLDHGHVFASDMRAAFMGHDKLLEHAVGMNVWHFQTVSNASSAPKPLRTFCETTTRELIAALRPNAILCFGQVAFDAIVSSAEDRHTIDSRSAIPTAKVGGSRVWRVPHLTGSWTRKKAALLMPQALVEISNYLK